MTPFSRRHFCSTAAVLSGITLGAAQTTAQPAGAMPTQVRARRFSPKTLPPSGGYSHISEASGQLFFLAGQIARDAQGNLVGEGDFGRQIEQVFLNISLAAEAVGLTAKHIIKLNYLCDSRVDRSLLRHVNRVRDQYVDTARPPASTFVFVAGLARAEWLIEIEAILASNA